MSDDERDPGPRNTTNKWTAVGSAEFPSMEQAKSHLKMMEGGQWKWSKSPGDGKTTIRMTCNSHVDCTRQLRVLKTCEGFIIQGTGEHGLEPNNKRRKNSTLTMDMEKRVKESMDQGGRSAGLLVALTNSKAAELKGEGKNPEAFKMPEGGLLGTLKLRKSDRIPFRFCILTYP